MFGRIVSRKKRLPLVQRFWSAFEVSQETKHFRGIFEQFFLYGSLEPLRRLEHFQFPWWALYQCKRSKKQDSIIVWALPQDWWRYTSKSSYESVAIERTFIFALSLALLGTFSSSSDCSSTPKWRVDGRNVCEDTVSYGIHHEFLFIQLLFSLETILPY